MNRNRILNRPVEPAWARAALDVGADGGVGAEGRERLEIRLRDEGLAPVARQKVVETLHPVWINPPAETASFIEWARDRSPELRDLRPVHLIALMATYPFLGDLFAAAGRMLRNEGTVDSIEVRSRLKAKWGDRDSVGVATRKGILTLRSFGVLVGERGSTRSVASTRFEIQGDWALWAACGLLLSRGAESTDAPTVETAPEFFFVDLQVSRATAFPLLERVTSGDGRARLVLRALGAPLFETDQVVR
jgi:hypothetical protein